MYHRLLVAGTFDHFHIGHQHLLWNASKKCHHLIIIVAREKTVERIKGHTPKNSEQKRLKRLQEEKVPNVTLRLGREDGDVWKTIQEENPDAILLGYDQNFDTQKLKKGFPHITLLRDSPYSPEYFKSSKFNL